MRRRGTLRQVLGPTDEGLHVSYWLGVSETNLAIITDSWSLLWLWSGPRPCVVPYRKRHFCTPSVKLCHRRYCCWRVATAVPLSASSSFWRASFSSWMYSLSAGSTGSRRRTAPCNCSQSTDNNTRGEACQAQIHQNGPHIRL